MHLVRPGRPDRSWTYDELGRVSTFARGSGSAQLTTTYGYDVPTGTVSVTRSDGRARRVGFDQLGNVVREVPGDGAALLLRYDAVGRLVQLRPAGRPSSSLGYSPAGRLTADVPPTDVTGVEPGTMSADGLLASISGPGSRAVAFERDATGRLSGWTIDRGHATVAYDPVTALPVSVAGPSGVRLGVATRARHRSVSSGPDRSRGP